MSQAPIDVPQGSEQHSLRLERRDDGVAVLVFDVPGEPINTLRADFAEAFHRALDDIEGRTDIQAVVLSSGKPDSFIAGADIKMLEAAGSAEAAENLSRTGQKVLERIERARFPFVAAINGACLGGGLEVALACRGRVASTSGKTKLGLPEVQLGLLPGLGGTQRLPRLIGVQAALDLMLTGKQVDARKALKLGLVDERVPPAIVVEVAAQHAARLAKDGAKPRRFEGLRHLFHADELTEMALAENPIGRKVLFDQARKRLLAKTHGKYPAPERILDVVRVGLERGARQGYDAESEAFGKLAVSAEARQLMGIFFATQQLKKETGAGDTKPRTVQSVGVLGAGLMGAGIAYVSASLAGKFVRIKDRDDEGVARGLSTVRSLLDERVKRRRMTPTERDTLLAKVTGTTDYTGFRKCEVVIEAVFEDLELKRGILADVEEHGHPEAIFASNTSSLPIAEVAARAKHPERVIGMHYFSPVPKMPLLEIITTDKTEPWVTATCVQLGKQQGKTVIVVRDGVGFFTSRILGPYLNEAAFLLSEGASVEKVDRALVEFGFPVGPIALLDEVGIDVGHKVSKILHDAFGERMQPAEGMSKLIEAGWLGRKNKQGFYQYGDDVKKGHRPVNPGVYGLLGVTPTKDVSAQEISERCVLQMVNEAVHCIGEQIVARPVDGDVGAIFGLGFPPYLGGPFRYVDALGPEEVVRRLERLQVEYGGRFQPAPQLVEMARSGAHFYG